MLPRSFRMVDGEDFRTTLRHGRRIGGTTMVMHTAPVRPGSLAPAENSPGSDVRVGFVVSKAVGNAVVRNRVKRRLRHLAATGLPAVPAGTRIVIRALPAAATRPELLIPDFDRAWRRSFGRRSA